MLMIVEVTIYGRPRNFETSLLSFCFLFFPIVKGKYKIPQYMPQIFLFLYLLSFDICLCVCLHLHAELKMQLIGTFVKVFLSL